MRITQSDAHMIHRQLFILSFVVGLLGGCVSFGDGPFEPVSGTSISSERLKILEAEHASMDRVKRELGDPNAVNGEEWTYVTVVRRVSVNTSFFSKTVTCQFVRKTYVIRFDKGRVSHIDTQSQGWTAQEGKDKECKE